VTTDFAETPMARKQYGAIPLILKSAGKTANHSMTKLCKRKRSALPLREDETKTMNGDEYQSDQTKAKAKIAIAATPEEGRCYTTDPNV